MCKFLASLTINTSGAVSDWVVLSAGISTLGLFVLYEVYVAI
ncbi:MAG TPA: hypothetical protein VLV83_05335 [Acidobacteriota bacterium]|nr:hypothetical protein [Acidobacteriota bacterium]